MRRPTRLGLAILATLPVVAAAYTTYWFVVAREIKDGVIAWAQSARADKIDASWRKVRVTGFPFSFRVELETAGLRDNAVSPPPEIRVPSLSGTARPWDFDNWRIEAPAGFSAELGGAGERVPVKLTAQTAEGVAAIEPQGGWKLWLTLQDIGIAAAKQVRIGSADAWIIVPTLAPRQHTDPKVGLAFSLRQVKLPVAVAPLGDNLDGLALGVTVKGPIPNGKLAQVAAAWRDMGGTIALDNLRLNWGGLSATATGTVALDQELQPTGALSGAIQGYDQILAVLVQNGQMRAADAGLARIALTVLAKNGPDGRPEINIPFTIQNGQMFLGPAKLGSAPRLTWE